MSSVPRGPSGVCPIPGYTLPTDQKVFNFENLVHEEKILYDTNDFAFLPVFQRILSCEDLGKSHVNENLKMALSSGNKGNKGGRNPANKLWHTHSEKSGFYTVYHEFLRKVVAPLIGDPKGLVIQSQPTFRCHLPDERSLGRPHTDSEYFHQPHEINFWIPLCKVWGSNSLWSESQPGVGDFHPFELDYGEGMMFYGNKCHHYTIPNDTGFTRVSFDFRVIPYSMFNENYEPSRDKKSGKQRFSIGVNQYYTFMPFLSRENGIDCEQIEASKEPDTSSKRKRGDGDP